MAQAKSTKPRTKNAEKPSLAERLQGAAKAPSGRPCLFTSWGQRHPQSLKELNEAIDAWQSGAYVGEGCETVTGLWRAIQQAFAEDGIELPTRVVSSFTNYMQRREETKNKTRRSTQSPARETTGRRD